MISSLLSLKYVDEVNNFIGIIIGQFACYCQGKEKPPVQDNPLYDLDNVILISHMGWKGLDTRKRLVDILAANIKGYEKGEPINRII